MNSYHKPQQRWHCRRQTMKFNCGSAIPTGIHQVLGKMSFIHAPSLPLSFLSSQALSLLPPSLHPTPCARMSSEVCLVISCTLPSLFRQVFFNNICSLWVFFFFLAQGKRKKIVLYFLSFGDYQNHFIAKKHCIF